MGKCFLYGNGVGSLLNFDILDGTTEPSNPTENAIWVNTPNTVTGYQFSATQPANMAEGEVWILVGTSSNTEFNALKRDAMHVYPVSAKQYVSGALVNKGLKIYQNGKWRDPASALYFVDGGVKKSEQTYISATQNSTLTSNNGLLTINPSGESYRGLYFRGKKENQATLNIDGVFTGNETTIKVWNVGVSLTYQNYADVAIASAAVNGSSGTLDISNLANGEYYFGFCSKYNETNQIRNFYIK